MTTEYTSARPTHPATIRSGCDGVVKILADNNTSLRSPSSCKDGILSTSRRSSTHEDGGDFISTGGGVDDATHNNDTTTMLMLNYDYMNMDLGGRVDQAQKHAQEWSDAFGRKQLGKVMVAILISFVLVNACTFFFLNNIFPIYKPDQNTMKLFDEFDDPYDDIIMDTIPFIQKWYRSQTYLSHDALLLPTHHHYLQASEDQSEGISQNNATNCIKGWYDRIEKVVDSSTSPELVDLVVRSLGLSNSSLVVDKHLADLLREPQPLSHLFAESMKCQASSLLMGQLCLSVEEDIADGDSSFIDLNSQSSSQQNVLIYFVNVYAVLALLTTAALDDMALLSDIVSTMKNVRAETEDYYSKTNTNRKDRKEFLIAKYRGVTRTFEVFSVALAQSMLIDGVSKNREALQVNILEAVKLDATVGHSANARVGLALAASVPFDPVVENHTFAWKLSKEWVDAYISWNLSFIVGNVPVNEAIKLFIPSVSCTASRANGDTFIAARTVSLALGLMMNEYLRGFPTGDDAASPLAVDPAMLLDLTEFFRSEIVDGDQSVIDRFGISEAMGVSNLKHVLIPNHSHNEIEEMLYNLCDEKCHDGSWKATDKAPQAIIDDENFPVYVGIILWGTVMFAGFGLELLCWLFLIKSGWSAKRELQWRYAQFIFPLFAAITFGLAFSHDFMALLFLVSGLWKFGMPETISYMYIALYDTQQRKALRFANFCNSVGTAMHHSAATIPIVMLLVQVVQLDRHITDPILILLVQHWFVLVKYVNLWLYGGIELVLEIWFELTILSNFQYLVTTYWSLAFAAGMMLLAHWLYLLAVLIEVLVRTKNTMKTDTERHLLLADAERSPTTEISEISEKLGNDPESFDGECDA